MNIELEKVKSEDIWERIAILLKIYYIYNNCKAPSRLIVGTNEFAELKKATVGSLGDSLSKYSDDDCIGHFLVNGHKILIKEKKNEGFHLWFE